MSELRLLALGSHWQRFCYLRSEPNKPTKVTNKQEKDMIPMHPHEGDTPSQNLPSEENNEKLPTAAQILYETGEILDNAEGHKYLDWLQKVLCSFHNTTINPKHLELRDFTKSKVIKVAFHAPPMDPNIALPSQLSLLQFYLERNGKAECFAVENCMKDPATAVFSIHLAFI